MHSLEAQPLLPVAVEGEIEDMTKASGWPVDGVDLA